MNGKIRVLILSGRGDWGESHRRIYENASMGMGMAFIGLRGGEAGLIWNEEGRNYLGMPPQSQGSEKHLGSTHERKDILLFFL